MTFGDILFRKSLVDSILELCRTRRTRLYVLREINQIRLQMKTYFFMEKLGSRSKSWGKRLCFGRESPVFSSLFLEGWKKEDQCTSIFHFADRPELPYEVDFWRKSFPIKIGFRKIVRFCAFLECVFLCFSRDFGEFVRILARNPDEKLRDGVN